ncbi:hypothetical protein CS022_21505 [Veronia nyctiphanis]|uniref:Uncharacterized protein n=1 Tax=Veronia nyctiphanis TaxID=1278244 RepID=A0A4Q0YQD5_9GAMM|nr:hypothetical protein [Veronia nyctiphanis]RXJ71241.1 hypothetical protein CS022_21505 [Veronia nyctiphanis]
MRKEKDVRLEPTHEHISDEIIRNAVELQGLQVLQGAADSWRDERLSNIIMKNKAMLKWLENPEDKSWPAMIAQIGANSMKEDVKQAYALALERVGSHKGNDSPQD